MKKFIFLLSLTIVLYSQTKPEINSNDIKYYIEYLASDKLEGRFTGTVGEKLAGDFIAQHYKKLGLKPLFNGNYFQEFEVLNKIEISNENKLQFIISNNSFEAKLYEDFVPLVFSDNQNSFAENGYIAGFGISKKEYDNLKDLNLKDKFVIIFDGLPKKYEKDRQFYVDLRSKVRNLIDKGAKNILIVYDVINNKKLPKKVELDNSPVYKNTAIFYISKNYLKNVLKNNKIDFDTLFNGYHFSNNVLPFELKNINVKYTSDLRRIYSKARNVAAIIDNNSNEYLVIGAHYDHLGWGEFNSLYTGDTPQIHNGADDNASGTAGVMELAEYFATPKEKLKYNLIFVNFTGEELGLLGSAYFVKNSPIPLEQIKAMINFDMIGRLDTLNSLTINGTGTSSVWKNLIDSVNYTYKLNISKIDDGYSPSDNTSFYAQNIPVLFFFTGLHKDYHRPSDDADKINFSGESVVLNYAKDLILSMQNKEFDVIITPRKKETRMSYKVYVGTVPDFSFSGQGYKISSVTKDSPADKAGIKGGDIIVKFGEVNVANIYDYTYALSKYNIGDEVDVVVQRNTEQLKLKVVLTGR